jgi:hypothetical protein
MIAEENVAAVGTLMVETVELGSNHIDMKKTSELSRKDESAPVTQRLNSSWQLLSAPPHVHQKQDAEPVKALATIKCPTKPEELLDSTWGIKAKPKICAELLQSSFVGKELELSIVLGTANGFVDTVRSAYNGHHHLTLRFVKILDPFSDISLI